MFKNSFKMIFRLFRRQKAYTVITVGGLALAMTVGILTVMWAQYEFSFDRFHRNGRDIYRFVVSWESGSAVHKSVGAPLPLGPLMEKTFPEVRAVARLGRGRYGRVASSRVVDFDSVTCVADPSLLTMFDFPLLQGDPKAVLIDPHSIVLTESAARKFFGTADPVGQPLLFLDKKIPMTVTGVMKDIPKTSDLQFDMLAPLKAVDTWYGEYAQLNIWEDWTMANYSSYIQLAPRADPRALEAKVARVLRERNPKSDYRLSLQPLFQAHLHSGDFSRRGLYSTPSLDAAQVRIFLMVALVVMIMACVNYTNLATARSLKRVKEIAVRKVNGASRRDIARQFLGESLAFSFVALVVAVFLALSFLPAFRTISGRDLDLALIPKVPLVLSLVFTAVAAGLLSGLYPAFYVASLAPVRALREKSGPPRRSLITLRRFLVAGQIVGSATLVVVTAVLLLQLRFIRAKDLGFNPKNVLVVSFEDRTRLDAFKADLLRHPGVIGAADGIIPALSAQGHRQEGDQFSWEGKPADANVPMDFIFADKDYAKTLGLAMASGRFFSAEFPGDRQNFVLNESAVKAMGLDDPIGKSFTFGKRQGQIIGVVKDFHMGTLKAKIAPAVFLYMPFVNLSIRIDPRQTQAAIHHIEMTWKTYVKDEPFSYAFLEDRIEAMYEDERRAAGIVSLFGAISLTLSLLGLFGLAAFLAEQKTKEIGVRKVLGASVGAIVRGMTTEFVLLVGVSAVFVIAVALLTLGGKIVRAARRNPVDSLRYE